MSAARVTIGLPFFNAAATLADAIRSVFAQTHTQWRLLLVDDGSSDDSLRLARNIDDPRVTIISDGVNRGLIHRLNQITREADGDLIARLDADDLMHPDRLARQLAYLAANPDKQIAGTATYTLDERSRVIGKRGDGPFQPTPRSVLERGLFVHPTITARRDWMLRNPYDPEFFRAEDLELWCRLSLPEAGLIDEPLYFYRESVPLNLRAYVASCVTTRKVLRRYGPAVCGRAATSMLLAGRWVKEGVYRLSGTLGYQRYLLNRRSRPLDAAEQLSASQLLAAVRTTQVPGMPVESLD